MVISEIGCTKFKNFQNSWRGGCKSDKGDILRDKKKRIKEDFVYSCWNCWSVIHENFLCTKYNISLHWLKIYEYFGSIYPARMVQYSNRSLIYTEKNCAERHIQPLYVNFEGEIFWFGGISECGTARKVSLLLFDLIWFDLI